ncbi:hypothetical protein LR48_Vigan10g075400 [Vigna angularis]|uniref:Uncharacterized protein n=1 Tax=Phaseolus angularis TaxID=3914 RepID=A0A0L9VIX1_PHAAN|nr:hypothetical protein LR48_Vigan10g075400 [Vigna angularis]
MVEKVEEFNMKPTRGATRLRQLILRRNAGERTLVIIDVVTRVAFGPNANIFRTFIGVVARDRISILTPLFDHVSEADRNLIWQDLLEIRSKAQGISSQNKTPHLLSRGGYKKFEEKIMKQKSDSRLSLSEGGDPPPPPSPPSRHKSSSRPSSYELCKEYEQNLKQNITKEITQEITEKVRAEWYDEVAKMVMCQFQQYESHGMHPQPSPVADHVVPLTEAAKEVAQLLVPKGRHGRHSSMKTIGGKSGSKVKQGFNRWKSKEMVEEDGSVRKKRITVMEAMVHDDEISRERVRCSVMCNVRGKDVDSEM